MYMYTMYMNIHVHVHVHGNVWLGLSFTNTISFCDHKSCWGSDHIEHANVIHVTTNIQSKAVM